MKVSAGSLFSFNLLLSHENEFSGGGTYFPELGALYVQHTVGWVWVEVYKGKVRFLHANII